MSNTFAALSPHPPIPLHTAAATVQTALVSSGDLVLDEQCVGTALHVGGDGLCSLGAHTLHEAPVSLLAHVVPPAACSGQGTHERVGDHMAPSRVGDGNPQGGSSSLALESDRQLLAVVTPRSKRGRIAAKRLTKSITRVPHERASPSVLVPAVAASVPDVPVSVSDVLVSVRDVPVDVQSLLSLDPVVSESPRAAP